MLCAFGNDASCPGSTNTQRCCARGASPSFVNGFLQLSRYTAHLYTHRGFGSLGPGGEEERCI